MDYKLISKLVETWIKNEFPQVNICHTSKYKVTGTPIFLYANCFGDLVITFLNRVGKKDQHFIVFDEQNLAYDTACKNQKNINYLKIDDVFNPEFDFDSFFKPIKDYLLSDDSPLPILDKPSPVNNPIAK